MKKFIGFLFIIIGICVPLYSFSNVSLNMYREKKEYENYINESKNDKDAENEILDYNKKISKDEITFVDPFSVDDYKSYYEFLKEDRNKIFAYLSIPKINLNLPIRLGATHDHLAKGLAHIDNTSLPTGNAGERPVIAGHRGFYKAIMFLHLNELEKGDSVTLERGNKVFKYLVTDKEIIKPENWEKLLPVDNREMLTLFTCDPAIATFPDRLIVNCERVKDEVEIKKIEEKTKVTSKVKVQNYSVYVITGLLCFALIFTVFKSLKYLFGKSV